MKENEFPKYVANAQKWARAMEIVGSDDESEILVKYKEMAGLVLFEPSFRQADIEEFDEPSSKDVIEAEAIIEEARAEEEIAMEVIVDELPEWSEISLCQPINDGYVEEMLDDGNIKHAQLEEVIESQDKICATEIATQIKNKKAKK